jgi:hypothetical protein
MGKVLEALDAAVAEHPGLTPAMTAAEQALLRAAAAGRMAGLEFGCGGSTGVLLESGIRRLTSVESDAAWIGRVGSDPRCAAALREGRLRLLHADLGATTHWGWPSELDCLPRWPCYWRDAWDRTDPVDFVLVDGRFRVACAIAAAVRVAADACVMMHDFWSRAAYRAPVLRHYDVVGSAGSLVMLRVKPVRNAAMLAVDLAAHAFDAR